MQEFVFYSLASLITLNATLVITRKNPIASAIFLVITLFLVAATYAALGAEFAAAIQILVYAGAIMVLFLFVIMLLNLSPEELAGAHLNLVEWVVVLFSIAGFVLVGQFVSSGKTQLRAGEWTAQKIAETGGNTKSVGLELFYEYVWPFEIASILILLAIVASIVIAKKDKKQKI